MLCLLFYVSCTTNKTNKLFSENKAFEYWMYRNHGDYDTIFFEKDGLNDLDNINFNDFHKLINMNVSNYKSIELEFKVKDFFNKDDTSNLKVHILHEINNPTQKQYLGYIHNLEKTSIKNIYLIFNVIDNRVKSSFVAHLSLDNGFGSETQMVTFKSDNNYELMVSGWADGGGKFEHLNCFKITEEGFIDTSVECKKGSKK